MFRELGDLTNKNTSEKLSVIENYLRSNQEQLEYVLTHLDSSNITEIDTKKTRIYEGEDN